MSNEDLTAIEEQIIDPTQIKQSWEIQRNSALGMAALQTVFLVTLWQSPSVREAEGVSFFGLLDKLDFDNFWPWATQMAIYVLYRCIAIGIPAGAAAAILAEGLLIPNKEFAAGRKGMAYSTLAFMAISAMCTFGSTQAIAWIISPTIGVWFGLVCFASFFGTVFAMNIAAAIPVYKSMRVRSRERKAERAALEAEIAARKNSNK